MSERKFQKPLKRPISNERDARADGRGHPIDLPERMLDELQRLFLREADLVFEDAVKAYMAGRWGAGAELEQRAEGLIFDSKEIARLAYLKHRDRVGHEERNLLPWERVRRRIKPYGSR